MTTKSMPLTKRKKPTSSQNENSKDIESNSSNSNDSQGKAKRSYAGIILHYSFLVSLILSAIAYHVSSTAEGGKQRQQLTKGSENKYQIKTQKYNIHIDFQHDDEAKQNIGLGPHSIYVMTEESCPNPQVYVTVEGDAMVAVELHKEDNLWRGKFHVPMGGNYHLQTKYVDCKSSAVNDEYGSNYDFQVISDMTDPIEKEVGGVAFVNGAWIAKEKVLKSTSYFDTGYPYTFANPEMVNKKEEMTTLAGNGEVVKESVVTKSHGYYRFKELSNYETVCWIGSQSANDLWEAFKSIRGGIFTHQRPFKFHYFPVRDLTKPDQDWLENDNEAMTRFRKCKHILISFDEPETPLSQSLYQQQIITFIKHLLNAFNEEKTFPSLIWMFTVMESPLNTKNCYDPVLPRTTNHPCNEVLRDLFQDSPFPSRVRLLDNTDVSSLIMDENRASILAIIALRIFVFAGHQVQLWREDGGQIGGINGLTKNGVTTPNYKLERYDWSQTV